MPGKQFGSRKIYLSIVQGSLRQKVDESTKGAQKREYELKDGTKKVKYELVFMEWSGLIKDLRIKDTDFGEVLEVEFDDAILTMNTDSRYFQDFVKKIMGANVNQTISVHPYDFEADGKKLKGISMEQNGVKLKNYYWNDVDKVACNGIPLPIGDTKYFKKKDWQKYYLELTIFLTKELEKVREVIEKRVPVESTEAPDDERPEPDNSDIRPDEIVKEENEEPKGDGKVYVETENPDGTISKEEVPF